MKFEWTKDLETGYPLIDREHKELFNAVNQLMDACSAGKGRAAIEPAAKFLLDYVNKHFSHEEELQMKSKFPDMTAHKKFHAEYTKKLKEIVSAIKPEGPSVTDLGNINRHIALLVSHIRTSDKKLADFLNKK